jgi:drug/metabolite transporter (DMT)-like permease
MKLINILSLFFVVFLWGSSFALIKIGVEMIPPITLAFLRFLIAVPFLIGFTYLRNRHIFKRSILKDWKIFAFLGVTGVTLQNLLQNVGLQFTTASNASLIIGANPIFIALLDSVYLKEKVTLKLVSGVVLAFSGIVFVIKPTEWPLHPMMVAGDLLCLCSGFAWACYSVFTRKKLLKYGANEITTYSMVLGTLFLLPSSLVFEKLDLNISPMSWLILLYLGLLCSGLAFLLWSRALEDVSATKAGAFLFFIPVVSVMFAHFMLSEPWDILFAIGTLLVLMGVAMTEL